MDIQITGLEQVQRLLKEVPHEVALIGFAKALDRAGGVIQAAVIEKAAALPEWSDTPLSEHTVTDIEINAGLGVGVNEIGFDQSQDERTGTPQDLKAYWVEFGHKMKGHKPDKKYIKDIPPKPFMRPAFDESAERAIAVFAETLVDALTFLEK